MTHELTHARDALIPLMTVDAREHASCSDCRHARPKYLGEIWKIVNWKAAAANFA